MSTPRSQRSDPLDDASSFRTGSPSRNNDGHDAAPIATYATFSPATLSSTAPSATSAAKRRSTILVHQKSPLLLATPPQVTRALAYSHPFMLPMNKLAGLLSWTAADPWESFLLVAMFWGTVLYGDVVVRAAGPVVFSFVLIAGMYGRRFSPLSSSGWSERWDGGNSVGTAERGKNLSVADTLPEDRKGLSTAGGDAQQKGAVAAGHSRSRSAAKSAENTHTRHQKTLDEMVETLKEFTARCNILLEPLLELTDFLSTQRTPTSATTRPALTALFVRILLCSPFWFALTLPPWKLVTTRRVVLVCGTIALTWHAPPVRVARAILWRSATVRKVLALVTGLRFEGPMKPVARPFLEAQLAGSKNGDTRAQVPQKVSELTKALRRAHRADKQGKPDGVRFTFIIFENQRRWVGLGWTNSLFAYERAAWTDEHDNSVPPRGKFELPEVEDGSRTRWRWVNASRWRVDGVADDTVSGIEKDGENGEKEWDYDGSAGKKGWVYYDNKWQHGRRGQDGWARWTRSRKWYRDAELVEFDNEVEDGSSGSAESNLHTPAYDGNNEPPSEGHTPTPRLPPRPQQRPITPPKSLHNPPPPYGATASESVAIPSNDDRAANTDTASSLSSTASSTGRSIPSRWKSPRTPSLRRRATDSSSRREEANEEAEEADALGTSLGLAPRGGGREGEDWGIGDDVRMGLE